MTSAGHDLRERAGDHYDDAVRAIGSQVRSNSVQTLAIVAGIGFLGAGTILKGNGQDTSHVKGLTTAAGLWMTAAIGTAAGMGREATALVSTVLALLVLGTMPLLVEKVERQDEEKQKEEGRKH